MELRLAEIESPYKVLRCICEGRGDEVAKKNLKRNGNMGSNTRGLGGVDWAEWKDIFYLDHVTMLGHSFGAVTVVEVLRNTKRFAYVSQGITYDKPQEKRLAIQYEFRNRIVPKFKRKMKRVVPPLQPPEREIWIHVASTPDEIHEWEDKNYSITAPFAK